MVEVLGALFYLGSKIYFLLRELAGLKGDIARVRRMKISAWVCSLIGLPFVAWILLNSRDWIFGWLELGAAPSMVLGLSLALKGKAQTPPPWVDWAMYAAVIVGIAWSAFDFGSLQSVNQGLEMAAVATFIVGSYQLAKDDRNGYLLFEVMFAAAGTLLFRQEHYWFALQQVASAAIILTAYFLAGHRKR